MTEYPPQLGVLRPDDQRPLEAGEPFCALPLVPVNRQRPSGLLEQALVVRRHGEAGVESS